MAGRIKISKKAVRTRTTTFHNALDRGLQLYDRVCERGYTSKPSPGGAIRYAALLQPDRRDIGELIFFEVAAKFEDYAKYVFSVEVRSQLTVTATQSEHIMGSSEYGLTRTSGWAVPGRLAERGKNVLGAASFHAKLKSNIGSVTYDRLTWAHRVRNRIAHGGGQASKEYVKVLQGAQIAKAQRRGMSPGRFLMDYPKMAAKNDRWLHRFLAAYREYGRVALTHLP
ncbi:hypothetical protein JYT86_00770 [bacterium AH-315-N03]|nr:hypothetical protein [bacterium AH-315-N03]